MDIKTAYVAFWYVGFNILYILTLYYAISIAIYAIGSPNLFYIYLGVVMTLMIGTLVYMFKEWIRFNRMVLERIIKYFLKR